MLWVSGDYSAVSAEAHVRKLFGDRPTTPARRFNNERPDRALELDAQFLAFLERSNQSTVSGRTTYRLNTY